MNSKSALYQRETYLPTTPCETQRQVRVHDLAAQLASGAPGRRLRGRPGPGYEGTKRSQCHESHKFKVWVGSLEMLQDRRRVVIR